MTEPENRRQRLIVDPTVQSRIILHISWPAATALAITGFLLAVLSSSLLEEARVAQIELPSLVPTLLTMIGFLVVSVSYLVFNAVGISHRIAGPMYRLRKTLESARAGDYSARANLRSRDFLVEVADELNSFLTGLELEQAGVGGGGDGVDVADVEGGPQGRGASGGGLARGVRGKGEDVASVVGGPAP